MLPGLGGGGGRAYATRVRVHAGTGRRVQEKELGGGCTRSHPSHHTVIRDTPRRTSTEAKIKERVLLHVREQQLQLGGAKSSSSASKEWPRDDRTPHTESDQLTITAESSYSAAYVLNELLVCPMLLSRIGLSCEKHHQAPRNRRILAAQATCMYISVFGIPKLGISVHRESACSLVWITP